jgi:hypothetical protein
VGLLWVFLREHPLYQGQQRGNHPQHHLGMGGREYISLQH